MAGLALPRAVFLGESLFERDIHLYWYPRICMLAETIRHGALPLWDLSLGFGQSALADPTGELLYPTTWLAVLIAPWTAYTIHVVAHLTLAGSGLTQLGRAIGLGRREATVAGVVFLLSGPVLSLVNVWHHLAGVAWIPWVVLALHRLVRRCSARNVLWLAAALGVQVLAGSGDMALLLTTGIGAGWVLAVARRPVHVSLARSLPAVAASVLLAALVSAGQWLPTMELWSRSLRSASPYEEQSAARRSSVPPAGFLRTLLPLEASGRLAWSPPVQRALFDSENAPFLGSLYLGPIALALAAAAFAGTGRRRLRFVLASIAAVAAATSLGPYAPVHRLLSAVVPGLGHLRAPSKMMVAVAFCLSLLCGLGLQAARRLPRLGRATTGLVLLGGLTLAAAAVLYGPALERSVAWGLLANRDGITVDALASAARHALCSVCALLAGMALLQAGRRLGARHASGIVAACLVCDLLIAHQDLHATAPPRLLSVAPPVLSAVDRTPGSRVYVYDYFLTSGAALRRLHREAPYAVAQPPSAIDPRPLAALAKRIYPVPPVLASWGVEGSYDLDVLGLQPLPLLGLNLSLRSAEGTPAHVKLLRLASVGTVIALHRDGFKDLVPGPSFRSLFPDPILTFRVPGSLPRVRAVGRARAREGRAALETLFDPSFDPESELVISGEGAPAAAAAAEGRGVSHVRELRGDRMVVDVESERPTIVTCADAWDPGWKAWVDGRPTPVLRANVVFRAVSVPAGRHLLEMRYRPWSAVLGLGLSALGVLVLAAGFVGLWAFGKAAAGGR